MTAHGGSGPGVAADASVALVGGGPGAVDYDALAAAFATLRP
jgi:hypothetical protein